jgi:integrase
MVTLRQDGKGNYTARKRLPDDVREEYGRLYGPRYEAKFYAPKSTKSHEAKRLYGEWLAEVERRIEAVRAARDGTGVSLTPQQARALAGDWYDWFSARHREATHLHVEHWRDAVREALYNGLSERDAAQCDPDELWRDWPEVRERVRPVLADIGETAQFLAAKQLTLKEDARNRFLDYLYDDLAAALTRLLRMSEGDYGADTYRERFPKVPEASDSGLTPWELFEKWVAEREPAPGTVESWRYVFLGLGEQFKDRSAASIMAEEATAWIKGLIGPKRSAGTVKKTWLNAANTVFRWALEQKHLSRSPFADVRVPVPRKKKLRERAFLPQEARTILRAASAINDTHRPTEAAKRWVPWLCAYSGARPGEMTQLRKTDVIEDDGIHAPRITPDAGTVKGGAARVVPLHEHLIAQGFLKFVAGRGNGPLFYNPDTSATADDPIKRKKPRYSQTRQRLADWVRGLGVDDQNIAPNHAWRHTFKRIADRAGITQRTSDYITGHAPKSDGAGYGAPTLDDMAEALKKFPRYTLKDTK